MKKIEYNKKYGNNDFYVTWQKTGSGLKCVKLTGTVFSDGEKDDSLETIVFIPNENIRAENEKSIIMVKGKIESSDCEWISADKPGGFKNFKEVIPYEKKIAKQNLS